MREIKWAVLRAAGLCAVAAWLMSGGFFSDETASARSVTPVRVFPIPASRYNSPGTQIAFRGTRGGRIGKVKVVGSITGAHKGRIATDSDRKGASFLPAKPFAAGETVTVTTSLNVLGGTNGSFSFAIARPAPQLQPAGLPVVPAGSNGLQHFRSRSDLLPPSITVTRNSAPASEGDIFLAPQFGPAQDGPMIIDPQGNLVWFYPTSVAKGILTTDFRVQNLFGKPVLTWWQGHTNQGTGAGEGVIFDHNYRQQAIVHAANSMQMDLHEFLITPQGQAYFIAVWPVWLSGYKRSVMDSVVQEIDVKTGLVLFEWHALDHISLAESYLFGPKTPGRFFDPYHVNSVAIVRDGTLVISARNTSAIYKIDHSSGAIIWRLGGKASSFKLGRGTGTAFQHDARIQPDGSTTAFDDGAGPPRVHGYSRGIRVALDVTHKTATLVKEYDHSPQLSTNFEGNLQGLGRGDVFLGWGQQPYFSEDNAAGQQNFDARFTVPTSSYRAFRLPWSAEPPTRPAIAIASGSGATTNVFASWNGATDVASWRVLAGPRPNALRPVASGPKRGFESAIAVHSAEPYLAAQALGSSGRALATSPVASMPAHLAIYGHSAFVSPRSVAGLPAGCFASHPCHLATTVSAGRTTIARTATELLAANSGGILYFTLSASGRAMLSHARRLPVRVTVTDSSGTAASTTLTLIPFNASGNGPPRSVSRWRKLRIVGLTDFVSSKGIGGVLAGCFAATPCHVMTTLSAGRTVIARTGRELLGSNELGYLIFSLTSAGNAMLAHARENQLGAHVRVTDGSASADADIALVRFS